MPQVRKFRNEYKIEGDTTILYVNRKGEKLEYYIDTDQLPRLIENRASVSYGHYGYGKMIDGHTTISLHRFLTGAGEGDIVDHLDSNPRNNRLSNLKIGTQGDNLANPTSNLKSNTGLKNIVWHEQKQKYSVKIQRNGKKVHKGGFKTLEEAVDYRNNWLALN